MKIVILDGYTENPGDLSWEGFERLGEVTLYDRTPVKDAKEIQNRIGDAKIVITNKTPLTRETIEACPQIRYIGALSTGYNVIDIEAAREREIPVSNIPAYGTDAVAQFTFALLLDICHHAAHHSQAVHEGRWSSCADFCFWEYPLIELAGKTMGIVGFGRIGQAVGRLANAFGMKVLAYAAHRRPELETEACRYVELEELFARSDIISLHCPLFPETEGMINKESIAGMKDGVVILNTGRGPLIVEQDLADALNSGKVYAAGLDVVSAEPISEDNPLLTAKNCLITPHIAWASKESRQRLMDTAVGNLEAFLAGTPVNVVNQGI
ncbi:MAG: D-2-hydroxyacid dehydrogenase [Lachnospiraceae bacterium]|jgi:glycerate dehydrogenase|nr:D-2-hydroxyacid dehydrogenase [Lachnospiraceae bacterium]MCI9384597.1 D-2-hydroxyacid dehydrogenase [Lachnospiraceae bacterium]MCI9623058.1 D-2-hydroxyacid dehydrogenase [Lachnospiraceae bacterium]